VDAATLKNIRRYWQSHLADIISMDDIPQKPEIAILTTGTGIRLVVKCLQSNSPAFSRAEVLQQLLEHLHRDGVPLALPIRADDGSALVTHGNTSYQLLPLLSSGPPANEQERAELPLAIGTAIGRLHRSLADFTGQIAGWRLDLKRRILDEALPRLERDLDRTSLARLHLATTPLLANFSGIIADLPEQAIHGDCHGGNFLTCGATVTGFIDLDHISTGPRIYDCAYLFANWIRSHLVDGADLKLLIPEFASIFRAYDIQVSLLKQERAALPAVIAAATMMLVEYFSTQRNTEWINHYLNAIEWQSRHAQSLTDAFL
jgi:Ser/Thr protein kinase RdoA (MazF antagonist)